MYYGGGLLGTILIVALIVFLVRRSRIERAVPGMPRLLQASDETSQYLMSGA
jgi:hypothetical protein